MKTRLNVRDFYLSYCQSHSTPRSTIWLNDLANLNSNSVSWGSTPRSGSIGRVISTQLWLLHWSGRVLQSEPNHSPHYRLQGQISVGGPKNQPSYLPTEINWNSFVAPRCSRSTRDSFTFAQCIPDSLSTQRISSWKACKSRGLALWSGPQRSGQAVSCSSRLSDVSC